MKLECFKAYDIRGRVPDELNEDLAWRIGRAYADEIQPGKVVVGHDARLESPGLAQAVMRGLNAGGRSSNTEPLLRLNVESRGDAEAITRHVSMLENLIKNDF